MKLTPSLHRLTLAALLVAASTLTFAPAAHADRGGHRSRHGDGGWRWGRPEARVMYRDHGYGHGGAGPAFMGLVGGFILGSALSQSHPVVVREQAYSTPYVQRQCAPPADERQYAPPVEERQYAPPAEERQYAPPAQERQYAPRGEERQYAPSAPAYRYEDGNGERWWDALDECTQAAYDVRGPRVIHEVDIATNRTVRSLYWKRDHWISDDDNWDGR